MSVFHPLKVKAVKRETHDTVSIEFEVPDSLKSVFNYLPGQYLTLRLNINGEQVNRSYSLCSNPFEDEDLAVAVKTVEGGKASGYLNQKLEAGAVIDVMEPMGNFTIDPKEGDIRDYIFFAGGSGVTPILSMLRALRQKEPLSNVTLFYGNRDSKSIIFHERLKSLKDNANGKLRIIHVLDQSEPDFTPYAGFMNKEMTLRVLREHTNLSYSGTHFYMCGPAPMMSEITDALKTLGISEDKIHKEYFTAKADEDKEAGSVGDGPDEKISGTTSVKLIYDGKTCEFEMDVAQNVLEAALDAGYDPPYSCMVAACCTCRAKLQDGSVDMDDRESLTDEEISDGYVLTCQAHPTSHGVVLNYDE